MDNPSTAVRRSPSPYTGEARGGREERSEGKALCDRQKCRSQGAFFVCFGVVERVFYDVEHGV